MRGKRGRKAALVGAVSIPNVCATAQQAPPIPALKEFVTVLAEPVPLEVHSGTLTYLSQDAIEQSELHELAEVLHATGDAIAKDHMSPIRDGLMPIWLTGNSRLPDTNAACRANQLSNSVEFP